MIAEQVNIFEISKPKYKIKKPIRLIELFAGIGSQAKALKNIGANFEHYRAIDFDKYAIKSYNAIHGTNFEPLDITKITAKDLGIVETDKYDYIMTYSFPCQDLSPAGKGAGMKKGSGTRSGLLWEVERLLKECNELPQILLMENVPQVINKKNLKDFREWELFLEKLGYSNYFELLNAKNYGIPQNRNRCFMVSVLGDYYYEFPRKQKLKYRLKDFLEDEVDEKYYLSDKTIAHLMDMTDRNGFVRGEKFNPHTLDSEYAYSITTNAGSRATDNFIILPEKTKKGYVGVVISEPIIAASRGRNPQNPSDRTTGIPTKQRLEINSQGLCNTLTTFQKDNYVLVPETTKKGYALKTTSDDIGVVVKGNYSPSGHNASRIVDINGIAPTVMENHGTITAIVEENKVNKNNIKNINNENGVFSTLGTNCGSSTSAGDGVVVGEYRTDEGIRTFKDDVIETLRTFDACGDKVVVTNSPLRIRKLTPKECWRLMGFSDEDFGKAEKVNSNSQLYKQAGNSIVVQVLEAIFRDFF